MVLILTFESIVSVVLILLVSYYVAKDFSFMKRVRYVSNCAQITLKVLQTSCELRAYLSNSPAVQ